MTRRAIFLDRDGTICEEVGYVNHVSRCRLLPGSLEALRLINQAGYLSIVTTNQAGVARGYFNERLVEEVHARLHSLVAQGGARLDAIYFCPHHPTEGRPPYRVACDCRKPRPGMILKAAAEHGVDLERSFAIGDGLPDIEAAAAAGVRSIQVLTGYGRGLLEHQPERYTVKPLHTAADLLEAVRWILAREPSAPGVGGMEPR